MFTDEDKPDETDGTWSMLIDIWLDGFASGLKSAMIEIGNIPEDLAGEVMGRYIEPIVRDPLAVEAIRLAIQARMIGDVSTGPAGK